MKTIRFVFLIMPLLNLGVASAVNARIEPPVLRVSIEAEPTTLDWNAARTSTDRFVASFLMRGLLKYGSANELSCDLCKSFQVSADGKTIKFELTEGEQWSDGVKLEAQHFVDSFNRLTTPSNPFKGAEAFREVASFKALSPTQLEITLNKALSGFTHLLTTAAIYPIRKDLVKGPKDRGENHASTAVLGPYQLAAWEHGKRVVIEGNPAFKGDRPVYRVDFVLGAHAQLLSKFKAGKLDILASPTGEDLMKLPGQRVQVNPYWATRLLYFNFKSTQGAEINLRKAILHALDRDGLPAQLRNGERRVTGLIPPGLSGYRELPLVTADLAQATKERASAQGKSLELTLLIRDTDTDRRVGEWIATQLEKIQIRIKLSTHEQEPFDLGLMTWAFETATPAEILRAFETHSEQNRGHWTNVGYDALLGQLIHEPSPSQAAGLVDQLSQLVESKEAVAIPLGYPTQPFVLGPRVVSFAITPFGDPDLVRIQLKLK